MDHHGYELSDFSTLLVYQQILEFMTLMTLRTLFFKIFHTFVTFLFLEHSGKFHNISDFLWMMDRKPTMTFVMTKPRLSLSLDQ